MWSEGVIGIPGAKDKEKYTDDIYIPASATGKSLHGDTVRVYVFRRKTGRRPEGEIVEIISRAKTQFVGRLELSDHFGFVIPDNNRISINFYIPKEGIGQAVYNRLLRAAGFEEIAL